MTLLAVRIDPRLWDGASELRRADWQTGVEDLISDAELHPPYADTSLEILLDGDHATLVFTQANANADAAPPSELRLPLCELDDAQDRYIAIIQKMDDDGLHASQLEALDMAKKLAHDDAARVLEKLLPALACELATYRRLFSLLLALRLDTTRLAHARGHKRR